MLPARQDTGMGFQSRAEIFVHLCIFYPRCLSTSGLIVGDLEHLADRPSSSREEVITFGEDAAEPYGCRDHVDL